METNIKLTIKNVYGRQLIYPACPQSARLAKLLNRKTLIKSDLPILKEIGFTIEFISQSLI